MQKLSLNPNSEALSAPKCITGRSFFKWALAIIVAIGAIIALGIGIHGLCAGNEVDSLDLTLVTVAPICLIMEGIILYRLSRKKDKCESKDENSKAQVIAKEAHNQNQGSITPVVQAAKEQEKTKSPSMTDQLSERREKLKKETTVLQKPSESSSSSSSSSNLDSETTKIQKWSEKAINDWTKHDKDICLFEFAKLVNVKQWLWPTENNPLRSFLKRSDNDIRLTQDKIQDYLTKLNGVENLYHSILKLVHLLKLKLYEIQINEIKNDEEKAKIEKAELFEFQKSKMLTWAISALEWIQRDGGFLDNAKECLNKISKTLEEEPLLSLREIIRIKNNENLNSQAIRECAEKWITLVENENLPNEVSVLTQVSALWGYYLLSSEKKNYVQKAGELFNRIKLLMEDSSSTPSA